MMAESCTGKNSHGHRARRMEEWAPFPTLYRLLQNFGQHRVLQSNNIGIGMERKPVYVIGSLATD